MNRTATQVNGQRVTVKIDGREYKLPEGMNLINAAATVGIYIPHYCYHPALPVDGSCRLCLVEMEGRPKLEPACNMVAAEGLSVLLDSGNAINSRQGMMEFLLANHPLDCPICDRGGECQLQRYSMDYGLHAARTVERRRRFPKPDFDPLIDIERNRCILCTRCVRFCDHVGGEHAMAIFSRGDRDYISTYEDGPVANILSGNVIDLCPVGTLTAKSFRFKARPWELFQAQTTCAFCSTGCRVTAWIRAGRVYRTTTLTKMGTVSFVIDEDATGFICNQGRFGGDYGHHPERFFRSSVKTNGKEREAAPQEAVEAAARRLKAIGEQHGRDAVGIIVSPRATNEEMVLAARLAREVIGTRWIDTRAYLADAEACREHTRALGMSRGSLERIEEYDTVIVLNGALFDETPVAAMRIRDAARDGKVRLAMAGWHHDAFLSQKASVSERVGIADFPPWATRAAAGQGRIGRLLKTSQRGLIVYSPTEAAGRLAGLLNDAALALKMAGGNGWEILAVDPARNSIGATIAGAECPGGAPGILKAITQGQVRALLVLGADGLAQAGDPDLVRKAFEAAEFVAVIDTFASEASERADVVMAGAAYFEKDGTYCDLNGGMACLGPAQLVPDPCRAEIEWLTLLANAMGAEWEMGGAQAVFTELMANVGPECPLAMGEVASASPGDECPVRCSYNPSPETGLIPGKWATQTPSHLSACDVRGPARFEPRPSGAAPSIPRGDDLLLTGGLHVSGRDHRGDRSETRSALAPKPYVIVDKAEAAKIGLERKDKAILRVGENETEVVIRFAPMATGTVYAGRNVLPEGFWDGSLTRCDLKKT